MVFENPFAKKSTETPAQAQERKRILGLAAVAGLGAFAAGEAAYINHDLGTVHVDTGKLAESKMEQHENPTIGRKSTDAPPPVTVQAPERISVGLNSEKQSIDAPNNEKFTIKMPNN